LGKPKGVFHDSIPGENGVGLRFRAEFFNILNHPNFGNPNNILNSPLFGRATRTLASSLGSGGANRTSSTFRRTGESDSQRSASTFDT
jgi:hypothetical protein